MVVIAKYWCACLQSSVVIVYDLIASLPSGRWIILIFPRITSVFFDDNSRCIIFASSRCDDFICACVLHDARPPQSKHNVSVKTQNIFIPIVHWDFISQLQQIVSFAHGFRKYDEYIAIIPFHLNPASPLIYDISIQVCLAWNYS